MHCSPRFAALLLALALTSSSSVGCSNPRSMTITDVDGGSPMPGDAGTVSSDGGPTASEDAGAPSAAGDASAGCVGAECEGYGDSCANPVVLEEGVNTFTVDASETEYLGELPCSDREPLDADVVFRYRARTDGVLRYRLDKTGERWALVVASGSCGEVADPLVCDLRDVSTDEMRGELPIRAGETYFFYLTTVYSVWGTTALPETFSLTLTEDRPRCDDGLEGVVRPTLEGAAVQNRPSHAVADADPDGFLFFADRDSVRRFPKSGGEGNHGSFELRDLGSLFLVGSRLLFALGDELTVYELSSDGGETYHDAPIAYWSTGQSGQTAVTARGDTLYGIVSVDGTSSELWTAAAAAESLPVSGTSLATLPGRCTSAAADAEAVFAVCDNDILRLDLTSYEVSTVSDHFNYSHDYGLSSSGALHVWDGDGDGVADALYAYDGGSHAYSVCGWGEAEPAFATQLARWVRADDGAVWPVGGGLAYDAPNQRLVGYDRSADSLFVIE